jgi:putative aldouronate transport system permease protein
MVFLLRYIPMFGMIVAFEEFKADSGFLSPWVGTRNFDLLWKSPVLGRIVTNTLVLNLMFIISGTLFSVLVALLLNEVRSRLFKGATQSLMFLPFFMGWAVVAMVIYGLIDYQVGTVNTLLAKLGYERVALANDPKPWPWLLTLLRVWKGTGSGCVIYLAVLTGVDPQLYEAAAIDGASRFQRVWHISIPMLVPTIILLTLLAIGGIFYGDFGMIYAVIGGRAMLYPTTDVIDTYIIRALQTTVNLGMSTAVGLSQSVLGFICVFGSNLLARWWSRRHGEDYSLF